MVDLDKLRSMADELEYYASLENTSLSETINLLVQLADYPDYVHDLEGLYKELEWQLNNYKEFTRIDKHKEVLKTEVVTEELVWL